MAIVAVVAAPGNPRAARLAAAFGGEVGPGAVVHLFAPRAGLGRVALRLSVARVAAVALSPLFPPTALPWWGRRFHRLILSSQAEARAWAAFVPLGRLVVVEPDDGEIDALRVVYGEMEAMARRG